MLNKINKIFKIIKFVIKGFVNIPLGYFLSFFVKNDKKYILFSVIFKDLNGKYKDYFIQNSKYLFLYLNSVETEYTPIWLSDNKEMIKSLKKAGFTNIYKRTSLKGFYYALKSKYWISSFIQYPTYRFLAEKAIRINLWHGTGFKRQGIDNTNAAYSRYTSLFKKLYLGLRENYSYFNANCEYEKQCHMSGYGLNEEQVKILGYPRLDVLYKTFKNLDLFMEDDYNNIVNLKNKGKKIGLYAPTWRNTGKDITGWITSGNINKFLSDNNLALVVKLHPMDKNKDKIQSSENIYIMDSDSDIYAVMNYFDFLITDYSSIYSDFLLLDRPIIFYPLDYKEYISTSFDLYRPYEEITPGIKVYNEQELLNSIIDVINNVDNYKNERQKLRDELYAHQDGKNCERVLEFIRSLDK